MFFWYNHNHFYEQLFLFERFDMTTCYIETFESADKIYIYIIYITNVLLVMRR